MVRAVLPHSLDSMPETEPIPMSTNRTPNTPLSEIYLGQVGQMVFLDDISSESTKRLFLACVFEILVSLYNEIYMQGKNLYKFNNTSILFVSQNSWHKFAADVCTGKRTHAGWHFG